LDVVAHYGAQPDWLFPTLGSGAISLESFQRAIQTASRWADWNAKRKADRRLKAAFAK
jgi:hypothetical protein